MISPSCSYRNDSLQPECTGDYRFGFQGQETDPEYLSGAVSFKYRVHDARIGRFLSVDPLTPEYPWNSTYAFSENVVINAVELEGLEKMVLSDSQGSESCVETGPTSFKDQIAQFESMPQGEKEGSYISEFNDGTNGLPPAEIYPDDDPSPSSNDNSTFTNSGTYYNTDFRFGADGTINLVDNAVGLEILRIGIDLDVNKNVLVGGTFDFDEWTLTNNRNNKTIGLSGGMGMVGASVIHEKSNQNEKTTTITGTVLFVLSHEIILNENGDRISEFIGVDISASGGLYLGIEGQYRFGFYNGNE
jgi:RHS repeat-associated protein